jgi:hypothetical protein
MPCQKPPAGHTDVAGSVRDLPSHPLNGDGVPKGSTLNESS